MTTKKTKKLEAQTEPDVLFFPHKHRFILKRFAALKHGESVRWAG